VKAAPQISQKHGETVCCAGVDIYGNWLRLYPVAFRTLEHSQKFGRWDRIRFRWRKAADDGRPESRRVDQGSLEIVGDLKKTERSRFLATAIVTGLDHLRAGGKSLALLRPQSPEFFYEKRDNSEVQEDHQRFEALRRQTDLFAPKALIPYEPCPYKFKYRYRSDDGNRVGTCQDWEVEATFRRLRQEHGETEALQRMMKVFGEDYPKKGMALAMGTHSRYPDTWLINGIIRLEKQEQMALL
jgi:hypothetical protein